jgi:WD40 repeat protein
MQEASIDTIDSVDTFGSDAEDAQRKEQESTVSRVLGKQFKPKIYVGGTDLTATKDADGKPSLEAMKTDAFCVRFSPDSQFFAVSYGDGAIRVYLTSTGRLAYVLSNPTDNMPTTCLRFRPQSATSKTKNVLLAANSTGRVQHWHVTSGKSLHTIHEAGNQVYCVDYRQDGLKFATAGQDQKVRIYDEATKTHTHTLCGGWGKQKPGHTNRIFSLKFHPDDHNMLLSGGWDNTVQIWDMRAEMPVASIFGTHICGDTVDVVGNSVLTGSWRPNDQLQFWDLRTTQLERTIPWKEIGDPTMLYAAQLSKMNPSAKYIAAGGTQANECRVYEQATGELIGRLGGMPRGVYSVDFAPTMPALAISSGDGSVRIVDYLA